jgi:hypothetical protein
LGLLTVGILGRQFVASCHGSTQQAEFMPIAWHAHRYHFSTARNILGSGFGVAQGQQHPCDKKTVSNVRETNRVLGSGTYEVFGFSQQYISDRNPAVITL